MDITLKSEVRQRHLRQQNFHLTRPLYLPARAGSRHLAPAQSKTPHVGSGTFKTADRDLEP